MACNCDCSGPSSKERESPELAEIIDNFKGEKGAAIPILQEVQKRCGYLSEEALDFVAQRAKIELSQLYGVATFYAQFSLVPVGRNVISVCQGTACHVAGARKITEALVDELGIAEGETTKDLSFTLRGVSCLGACSLAPVMKINEEAFGRLTVKGARDIIRRIKMKDKNNI
ncbi:MAG: NADH-quinone oxidoreductase subunit NuoE [Actinomycetota bacterium]|nr:NADH-quinone oxidoreductase subunit NuoE [Actinomycetota bacterium]